MNLNRTKLLTVMVLATGVATAVLAHKGATGIVKERMDSMKRIGDASKAIGAMVKGETAYSDEAVAEHAATIYRHSQDIIGYFPEGSLQNVSEALPAIWQRWDEFERLSQALESRSAGLLKAARNSDGQQTVRSRFVEVAKTCKACHDDFRQEKR